MYIILTIIGCVIGYFYISAGFSQKDKPDSLKDDPRVKNLLWIIGPSVCIFTTDWNQYVSDINKTELFKCYIGGVLGGIILTLLLTFFIYIWK